MNQPAQTLGVVGHAGAAALEGNRAGFQMRKPSCRSCRTAWFAAALAWVTAFSAGLAAADVIPPAPDAFQEILVDGNADPSVSLPGTISGFTVMFYRYTFSGSNYEWYPGNVTPDPNGGAMPRNGQTQDIPQPGGTSIAVTLGTRRIAVNGSAGSSTQFVEFFACTRTPPNTVVCKPTPERRFRFRVDPALLVTPSGNITDNGQWARQVQLDLPYAFAGMPVTASCAADSGQSAPPAISVNASANTNAQGSASFTVTTSNMVLIAPSGSAPSGKCTFLAQNGNKPEDVIVRGRRVAPDLDISPANLSVPTSGATLVSRLVTVQTDDPLPNAPLRIDCSVQSTALVRVDGSAAATSYTAQKTADANGRAQFQIDALNLVALQPAATPHVRCRFNVVGLTATHEYFVGGRSILPQFTLAPAQVQQSGETRVKVTMNPAYPGFQISAACTQQNLSSAVTATAEGSPATPTDSSGAQYFKVVAPPLVITNPSTAVLPTAQCTFTLGSSDEVLPFRTGNTCTFNLSPLPVGCGDPAS
jgi:hypothetical protein